MDGMTRPTTPSYPEGYKSELVVHREDTENRGSLPWLLKSEWGIKFAVDDVVRTLTVCPMTHSAREIKRFAVEIKRSILLKRILIST